MGSSRVQFRDRAPSEGEGVVMLRKSCKCRSGSPKCVDDAGPRRRNRHEEERVAEQQVSFPADRRENQGAGRLAGRDAQPAPCLSQGSRSRSRRGVEMERGSGVYHEGLICTGETYKNVVKMTFAKGAALKDPSGLFNSSLDGNARRAIDIHEGDKVNEAALKDLIRSAVALNLKGKSKANPRRKSSKRAG